MLPCGTPFKIGFTKEEISFKETEFDEQAMAK